MPKNYSIVDITQIKNKIIADTKSQCEEFYYPAPPKLSPQIEQLVWNIVDKILLEISDQ